MDGYLVGPLVVADCARSRNRQALLDRGLAIEFGYPLAVELGIVDAPLPGVWVWAENPDLARWR